MGKYFVELSGKFNLEQQSQAIEGEEALAARFIGSRIWVNSKNLLTNLAEFEEIDTEPDPPLGLPKLTTVLPNDVTPDWTGGMIVKSTAISQVFLIRKSSD